MDFTISDKQKRWRDRVAMFMARHVYPAVPTYTEQMGMTGARKTLADYPRPRRTEADRAHFLGAERVLQIGQPSALVLRRIVGRGWKKQIPQAFGLRKVAFSSEVFNCSAPDTGNMEVLHRSSDATNIETDIRRDGDHYVINGRKWWSSGVGDPRCKVAIVMGKTNSQAERHRQQSQILVPLDAKGIKVARMLPVFGFDDAPHGHAEVILEEVRVPAENLLLGEGRGFEIAQGRLGPGRIHHCMRTIGVAEDALEKMVRRLQSRVAFGKRISEQSVWEQRTAEARIDIEMTRLLCLKAADMMDKADNKVAQLEIAMIKVQAPRMALRIIDDAIQAHGGAGVTTDFGLAKSYAGIRSLRLADGPDEVHCRAIARMEMKRHSNA